jgi:hypothetical protein
MPIYSPNYAFPNVSVSEEIIGPVSFNPGYRNTIGVVGRFTSGPSGAVNINSREQLIAIYGEDESPGSVFIRTAMQQGATDFVVSRVLPSNKPSNALLYLQAGVNPAINEAVTASSNSRTVGVTLKLSYISTPRLIGGSYLGAPVTVNKAALNLPGFEGLANYDFTVRERIDNASIVSTPVSATIGSLITETTSSIRKITITGSTAAAFLANAKPGTVLNTAEVGVTFTNTDGVGLKIITYPILESAGVWSVLVKGSVAGTLNPTTVCSIDAPAVSGVYFIASYNSRTSASDLLPLSFLRNLTYDNGYVADGFLVIKATDKSSQPLNLISLSGGLYTEVQPNINIGVGDASTVTPTELVIGSIFTVSFIQATVTAGETNLSATGFPNTAKAFGFNVSASEILIQLQNAISNSQTAGRLINEYDIGLTTNTALNTEALPHTLNLKTGFYGEEANRVYFNLNRTVGSGTPTDVLFGAGGIYYGTDISFVSGADTLKYASRYFYDSLGNPSVFVQAVSPGTRGNNIKVTVTPDTRGQFKLDVVDTNVYTNGLTGKTETYVLSNSSVDPTTGFYTETIDSTLIRAFYIPVTTTGSIGAVNPVVLNATPQRVAPPLSVLSLSANLDNPLHPSHRGITYLKDLNLTGGFEPVIDVNYPLENDYLNAVYALENADVAFIATDNTYVTDSRYNSVHSELIAQAERSTTVNGIRIAVLACPPRMTKGRVRLIKNGVNSSRVVFVAGWSTFSNSQASSFNSVSPTGHYVGKVAAIPPHISPASISEAGSLNGIVTVDHDSNPDLLNEFSLNGIDALYFDTGSKAYKVLNGRNSGINTNDQYVSVRRQADHIISDLYINLQWARSAVNNESLRSRVASACDAYLDSQKSQGRISGYISTVVDKSNNSNKTISQGQLNIRIVWTPVYPADYIRVNIIRDVTAEFTLSL